MSWIIDFLRLLIARTTDSQVKKELVVINDALARELLELVNAGQKIEAIKRLREATGMGLSEAKDSVDRLVEREALTDSKLDEESLEEVRTMLRRGQKIEAIKLYREMTGLGLADAKRAVEEMSISGTGSQS